jgi:hypothetical protein
MCSYFFLSIFLATLNTSTPKSKTSIKRASKEDSKKAEEKKEEDRVKPASETKEQKPKSSTSQIAKKSSPKKSLVPVKEEKVAKEIKKPNSKYALNSLLKLNLLVYFAFCVNSYFHCGMHNVDCNHMKHC